MQVPYPGTLEAKASELKLLRKIKANLENLVRLCLKTKTGKTTRTKDLSSIQEPVLQNDKLNLAKFPLISTYWSHTQTNQYLKLYDLYL